MPSELYKRSSNGTRALLINQKINNDAAQCVFTLFIHNVHLSYGSGKSRGTRSFFYFFISNLFIYFHIFLMCNFGLSLSNLWILMNSTPLLLHLFHTAATFWIKFNREFMTLYYCRVSVSTYVTVSLVDAERKRGNNELFSNYEHCYTLQF